MIQLTTTLHALHEANACVDSYKHLIAGLGGLSYGKDAPITLLQILDICGLDDALWALRACSPTAARDRFARELACDYAASVLPLWEAKYPEDRRPAQAIDVARQFSRGEATQDELAAAGDAARAAARAAAWDAAGDAAWAAAWAAAGAAAWAAAGAAAWAAAGAAEQQWQTEYLRGLISA